MEKKILIVDDAMFMRKSIRKILSEGGYTNVEEARDGDEAIAMFGEYNPDLVLLDITMPGKSGLEVLEEILRQDEDAAVVMCSAMGQETVIQRAIVMGARDFIVKPFKKDEFLRIVDSCFPIDE
nr:response regulator [uncultured Blautia sp.]